MLWTKTRHDLRYFALFSETNNIPDLSATPDSSQIHFSNYTIKQCLGLMYL